ncbi:hypothetical protein GCM10023172_41870 [Hymenobacter ginsengisoli]|uniref:Multidrug transporter n=2 Tax=Hymenobacteraceae TaxID=1853232 RepID=A0ABP8QQV4_9BACT
MTTPSGMTKTSTSTHMKADGTPDMRYKSSKTVKTGPMKADGTPDMRYKANKTKTTTTKSVM